MIILDEYRPLKMIFDQDKYIFDIRFKEKVKVTCNHVIQNATDCGREISFAY